MSSEKSVGKKIATWFKNNTWIYSTVVVITLSLVLAIVSINIGLGSSGNNSNNIFADIDWEWSFDDEDTEEDSGDVEEESASDSANTCKHTWKQTDKREPTCIEAGVTKYECIYCGETRTSYVRAEGHDFYGGECIKCGVQEG